MKNKAKSKKAETLTSKRYMLERNVIGYDMGRGDGGSWVNAMVVDGGILIDHANPDGDVVLSPKHAQELGAWLIRAAGAKA